MTCQEAALQLPWLLNGSLEPAERREVKDHLASCASCREALADTRLAWKIYAQHIPTAALVAYAEDERPEGGDQTDQIDPALLERHLADCPQCAAELEMVRASRLLVDHGEVRRIDDRLVGRQAAPAQRGRERGWRAAALAACLTGLVAIGGWVGTVQQLHRVETDAEPQVPRGPQGPAAAAGSAIAFNSRSPKSPPRSPAMPRPRRRPPSRRAPDTPGSCSIHAPPTLTGSTPPRSSTPAGRSSRPATTSSSRPATPIRSTSIRTACRPGPTRSRSTAPTAPPAGRSTVFPSRSNGYR